MQVSNSAQFVDAWVRINVLDKRAQTLGNYFTNLLPTVSQMQEMTGPHQRPRQSAHKLNQ